jgi:tetratricopeptide (TPR) repeat protein
MGDVGKCVPRLAVLALVAISAFAGVAAAAQSPGQGTGPVPMRQVQEAVRLAERGEGQRAMAIVQELLARNPKLVPALKLKGMLLEESGQPAAAGPVYEEALTLSPEDPDLLLKTGIFKLATGENEQALRLLQHCTKILPTDGDAQFYLAQAYHLNGQDDLALGAIRSALKAESGNPSIWQKYGELLCATGECESGLRWLLKAQHADATLPRIDFDIAATYYKLMDLAGAAQSAARALATHPNDIQALQLLAAADLKLAQWQEAESAFKQLRSLKADDVETLLGLGQCQVELKNYDASVETLQTVLRIDPTRLLAHFYLSRAYAGLGRPADSQHEAALHQLMMQHLTFARSIENEQREGPIKAQTQKLLSAHREEEAVRFYQQHFKGTTATAADAYVFIGKLYLFLGRTEDGVRCLHEALKIQPGVRGAHTYQGILALKLGDLSHAEKEFSAELANDPSYQLAIAEMGEVRYHQGRWSDAADYLAKSKIMTPELLYMLCDSYFRLGKVEDANLNAEALAAYATHNPDVMKGLGDLLVRNGQSDLAKRLSPALPR